MTKREKTKVLGENQKYSEETKSTRRKPKYSDKTKSTQRKPKYSEKTKSTRRKSLPNAATSTTNPIWTALGWNLGLHKLKFLHSYAFLLKGPAAYATNASQPWGLLYNSMLKMMRFFFPKWSTGGLKLIGENRNTRRKICPTATLSTTNPTWTDPGSNPGLRGERPVTNRLSHGRGFFLCYYILT
jgi:hypothetical protein